MLDVIEYIHQIRGKLERYGDWLDRFNKNIYNGFNAIFNALTLTLELLDYYYSRWTSYDVSKLSLDEVERLRKENAERVIEITKWAFVHAMSIIEFSVKDVVGIINPSIFKSIKVRKSRGRRRKRVLIYLRDIVEELKRRGCIGDEVYNNWKVLLDVRNLVVHSNAVANRDEVLRIGDTEIHLRKGQMLKGKLDFFVKLIDYAVEGYRYMLEALSTCTSR